MSDCVQEGLRDFFLAANAGDLRVAYELLRQGDAAAPPVDDWSEVEFAFNRLFVGPASLVAPPYSSVYLDGQPDLMGPTTTTIRHFYEAIGLVSPWLDSLPDDHLSLELDAYRRLERAGAVLDLDELRDLQAFLGAHLRSWVPLFVDRVRRSEDTPEAILFVASLAERVALAAA